MTRILKLLTILVVAAAAGWAGWWFLGARGHETAIARWFEARAAEGWQAELGAVETGGFPDRFVTQLDRPALADPEAGWAWSAPILTFSSPAFDPTRVTARFASSQTFAVPGERAEVASVEMEALLSLFPGIDLQLREGALKAKGLAIAGQSGWRAGAEALNLAVIRRDIPGEPAETHDVRAVAEGVVLPEALLRRIDPSGVLDARVTALRLDGLAVPDRPIDRHVIEEGRIGARTLVIRRAELDWDGMGLVATGRLDADATGRAEGRIDLTLRDWRRMLRLARTTGALPGEIADAVEGALELLAMLNRSDSLEVPVTFDGGRARIGPIPVGKAPRLLAPDRTAHAGSGANPAPRRRAFATQPWGSAGNR